MSEVQFFNGIKFKEHSAGYMCANINGKTVLMHRYVWEFYNGAIPSGYVVHHKDENKHNNAIENLECLPNKEHSAMHTRTMSPERKQKAIDALNRSRDKAIAWHKSEEGRESSRRNAVRMNEKGQWHKQTLYTCFICGKQFLGDKRDLPRKFCSGACKQYYRRHYGLNKTTRTCVICGKDFTCDKYEKTKTCSRYCALKLAHQTAPYNWRTGEGKPSSPNKGTTPLV